MKTFKYIILIICISALPVLLSAQEKTLTLQKCISMALDNNLDMKAGTVSVGKARDLQGTAFDMEKTSVTLSQDPTSGGSPDNGIKVSQSFEFPTVYAARRKYLKAETAAAQSRLAVTRNEVIRNVSSYYYTLLHQRRTIEILQAQDSVYGRFVSLASAKRKAGETGNPHREGKGREGLPVVNARFSATAERGCCSRSCGRIAFHHTTGDAGDFRFL